MEIKCTVEELKELLKKETSVAGTTDVTFKIDKTIQGCQVKSQLFGQQIN